MWHSDIDVLLQLKSQSRILNIELWLLALGYQSPHHIHCKLYRNIILMILTQLTGILGTFWALKCLLYLATRLISWPEPAAGMTVGPPSTRPWSGWDKSGQEKCSPPSDVQTQTRLPTCCQCAYTKIVSYSFIKFSFNFSPHPMYFGGVVKMFMPVDCMGEGVWGQGVAANYKCWLPGARTSSWGQNCQRDRISIITIGPQIENSPQFLSLT